MANPHDEFFKSIYRTIQYARELLQLAFSKEQLLDYDWDKLRIEKDTFKNKIADLVFSLPLRADPETKVKIFILLEHKSHYDPNLFNQLLIYQMLIQEHHIKETGRPAPIIPIVFYHGQAKWRGARSFQEAYFSQMPDHLKQTMLDFKIRLIDTHALRQQGIFVNEAFETRGALNLLDRIWHLKALKTKKLEQLKQLLEEDLALFGNLSDKPDIILSVIDYLQSTINLTNEMWDKVENNLVLKGIFQQGGYMDIRKRLVEQGKYEGKLQGMQEGMAKGKLQGMQEGKLQGMQEGKLQGMQEALQKTALNLLKNNIAPEMIAKCTGLSIAVINKLKNSVKDN